MKKSVVLIVVFLLIEIVSFTSAANHYVSTSGSASWSSCTNINTPCSLSTANSNAVAGDTILMRGGTYSTGIAPSNSGSSGNEITFRVYNSEIVTINGATYGVQLASKSYIIVDGIHLTNSGTSWVNLDSSNHNTIKNCVMSIFYGYSGIGMANSNYNQILDNILANELNEAQHDLIYASSSSSYNLFQGNNFGKVGHIELNLNGKGSNCAYNVIRNNYFSNPWHTGVSPWWGPTHTLVEGNIVHDDGTDDANGPRASEVDYGIQLGADYSIVRKNCFVNTRPSVNQGQGFSMGAYTGGKNNRWNRIYNNVIYNNDLAIRSENPDSIMVDNIVKNNIIYHNDAVTLGNFQGITLVDNSDNGANPLFNDAGSLDFTLQSASPMIDQGTYLTLTNGAGSSSTTLVVDDSLYFAAPATWGVPNTANDYIYVDRWSAPVLISSINYATNTITLASSRTWSDNVKVYLAVSPTVGYYGSGPDQGAYEYTSSTGCTENWQCTSWSSWSACVNYQQTRTWTCTDLNSCGTTIDKPAETETQPCGYLDKSLWTLVYVDSEETAAEDGSGTNSFDNNPATIWHTSWSGDPDPAHPHEIQIDLRANYLISGLSYLPRQDGNNYGTIKGYEFYVSNDGVSWGSPVASGEFSSDTSEKSVSFSPAEGRYVRLVALSEINDRAWTSVAEINLIGEPYTASACGPADSNGDSNISIGELINYISQWKAGGVSIGSLIEAIGKWKSGC